MNRAPDVIGLDNVSVRYRLAKQRIPSFKEYALHWMRGSLAYEELWALRDVSLCIKRGESVGVVGRNGAGKSTLLKVISRVIAPARGEVVVEGLVVPILQLGAGFDLELTGLENIYLNALLLGRTTAEVDRELDAIVDASGLGDFIRAPIRNYSSGMLTRLGFSVATAWVPDILILDEVLAVGDVGFVQRCRERLERIREAGTTLLLVSHARQTVLANCQRCVWIESGRVEADGTSASVLDRYTDFCRSQDYTIGERA
jgi:ABC-2 type transport system ATP-binding protein/lipopolysaccharide transport system ATP-binding protein